MNDDRASHLRVAVPISRPAIPVPEALELARSHHDVARDAYIDLLGTFGDHQLRSLLRFKGQVTVRRLRSTRDAAQRMAERALALVTALDACIDVCERADR